MQNILSTMNLVQVVPGMFPRVDGIGDFSLKLARRFRAQHGIRTTFLVCDPTWSGPAEIDDFPVFSVESRSSLGFQDAMQRCKVGAGVSGDTPVYIQFSPYGYEKRGCPFWLLEALQDFKQEHLGKLHVFFHELEISKAPPWSSGFWVPGLQRALIVRLAKMAASRYTHTDAYRTRLEGWGSGRVIQTWSYSSFGEPEIAPPTPRRKDMIIFGRAWQRLHSYTIGDQALQSLCVRLGVERIIDIGPRIEGHDKPTLAGIPVVRCGRVEADEVDRWMATSLGNFTVYPIDLLQKSSVYQVASANGNITFIYDDGPREISCAGLVTGIDFVPVSKDSSSLALPSLDKLSEALFNSYQPRRSSVTADLLAGHLF